MRVARGNWSCNSRASASGSSPRKRAQIPRSLLATRIDPSEHSPTANQISVRAPGVTKFAVGRERPNEGRGTHSFDPFHEFDRSFPSSHTARAFAVASVFADRYEQPIPLIAYGTAAFISVSRVYLNEHFASDVVAGAVLGFVIGKVLSWRHKDENRRWTVLPYVPDARGGLGMTFSCSF